MVSRLEIFYFTSEKIFALFYLVISGFMSEKENLFINDLFVLLFFFSFVSLLYTTE